MRVFCHGRPLVLHLVVLSLLLAGMNASAAIAPSPSLVNVTAGQSSGTINVDITYAMLAVVPPSATLAFAGLPPGVSTNPSPITFPVFTGAPPAAVSFQLTTSASTPGGTFPITLSTTPDIGAGIGNLTLIVHAPTLDATISPVPLSLAWGASAPVTVSTIAGGGFSVPVTYSFAGFPTGISTGAPQVVSAPYPPAAFTFSVAPRTPPGTYAGTMVASWTLAGPSTRTWPMTVVVQPPTLSAVFSPAAINIRNGGASVASALVLTPGSGYAGTPSLAWGTNPSGLAVTPATLNSPSLPPAQSIPVSVTGTAAASGPQSLTVRVTDTGAGIDVMASLVVNVTAAWDATISVTPPTLSLPAGESGSVVVSATGLNGFTGSLDVQAATTPSLTFSPSSFTLRTGESKVIAVGAAATSTPSLVSATFSATSPEISGPRTAALMVNVTPQLPEITSANPPALTAGTVGKTLRLTGQNFRTGATITFSPFGPEVKSTTVRSSTLAEVVIDTPPATTTGTYTINLRNPDGGATSHGLPVIVCPPNSLGAPLSVPTAAIVFPRPYTAISKGAPVKPRGVLATTGLGTVVGTWRLDGIPFDQFAIAVSGGRPAEVEAQMPIPPSSAGEHRLELVIEQPQRLTTEAVPLIFTVESHSSLRILSPDRLVVRIGRSTAVRWSLVPGASGYEVEIDPENSAWPVRIRTSRSDWQPDEQLVASLGKGTHRYRVAAVFPGEVRGEPTEWRALEIVERGVSGSSGRFADLSATHGAWLVRLTIDDQSPVDESSDADSGGSVYGQVAILGSVSQTDTDVEPARDASRIQLTGQASLLSADLDFKGTADISGRKDLDPDYSAASESRAWQVELGAIQSSFREDFRAGYSPPEFLDQSEFLAAGLARGGGLVKLTTPIGAFSWYDTFLDDAEGAVSAYGLTQRISGAGWEAPGSDTIGLFRVVGLRSKAGEGDSLDTEAESLGLFWRRTFSSAITLLAEGAWGQLETKSDDVQTEIDGYGIHLGLDGISGTLSYSLHLRSVDSGLVNPANLGLTPGAVPDRIGGDVMIGKSFGTKTLSLSLRRLQSGSLADGSGADVTEDSTGLAFMMPLGSAASMSVTSMFTTTTCDGDPAHFIAGSDRSMLSFAVALSETPGTFAFGQSLMWQDLGDEINPAFDQTVTMGSLTFGGSVGTSTSLNAMLSGTRSDSAPPIGTTDMWLATLQPTFTWSAPGISVTPAASYSRIESDVGGTSETEQYQLIALWSPAWWNSLLNLQLAGDWSRSSTEGLPDTGFQKRIVGTVILRWGHEHTSTPQNTGVEASRRLEELRRIAMTSSSGTRAR